MGKVAHVDNHWGWSWNRDVGHEGWLESSKLWFPIKYFLPRLSGGVQSIILLDYVAEIFIFIFVRIKKTSRRHNYGWILETFPRNNIFHSHPINSVSGKTKAFMKQSVWSTEIQPLKLGPVRDEYELRENINATPHPHPRLHCLGAFMSACGLS